MTMFLVVWVITAAGETVFLEAANGSYASNPNPADGAVIPGDILEDNIWTRLIFVPGATAVKHTGYFSDDYSKVESRAQDANLGPPPYAAIPGWEYTFMVGNPQVPPAIDSLVRGMTYYWCVDETDALGTTYPGDIWEFTIQDYKASSPNPPDEAVSVDFDVLLSWAPGFGVEDHDVYMGTSWENVNNAVYDPINPPPEYLGTVMEPSILVTGLSSSTTYYWRVDQVVGRMPYPLPGGTIYKGDVWSFKTKMAGLIAHWKFDEGSGTIAYDSAGNNDGTLVNGPSWTTGIVDGALDFDGVDDYVEFASVAALQGDNLTALAWVRVDESAGIWNPVIMQHDLNSNGYSFYIVTNRPAFYLLAGPSYVQAISPETINAEQWYHIAGTNDGTSLKLYVDGQLKDSEASTGFTGVDYNAYIGLEPTSMLYYKGLIDDVHIYNRALSAEEIEELYNSVTEPPVQGYKASSPNPPDEAVIVETDVLLSWSEGFEVEEHDVYMGTSWENVNNAVYDPNNPPPEYFGTVTDPCFMVTGLSENTTYYWRIDEVSGRFMPGTGTIYKGDVWEFTVMSYYATKPDPPNEAMYVNIDVLLSWQEGYDVDVHDVYIGTSLDLVFNADEFDTTGIYKGWTVEPNWPCSGLPADTKIYWRIDEVRDRSVPGSGTIYKGDVWCFTTFGVEAQPDYPEDGAVIPGDMVGDNIWTMLIFVPGATAVEHTGYFSDDYSKVESRAQDVNLGPPPYTIPGWEYTFFVGNPQVPPAIDSLVRGVTYYWCVDETDALGTTYPGDIWEFTIQDYKASSPNPPDEAVIEETDVMLSWSEGFEVDEHDVYFGTDFDDVNNAVYSPCDTDPPPEYLATVEEPYKLVTGLSENTTYYWRVDEVSGRLPPPFCGGTIYKGDVWSFTIFGMVIPVQATVDFDPDILNLASQGNWITSYIGLPEEYSVADIDPGSILLEGEIEPLEFWLTGDQQIAIVRFARSDVQAILEVGEVELTITGQLTDGTLFEAKDTIEVVDNQ